MANQEADVTFCIEVIEHVSIQPEVVQDLGRITRNLLVISSPNRNCPLINHDTALPFCHWLPLSLRDRYAALFGRREQQENNLFWSPRMVFAALPEFERESRFLQFRSYQDFLECYAKTYTVSERSHYQLRNLFMRSSSLLGRNAVFVLPNLASTFRRKATTGVRATALG